MKIQTTRLIFCALILSAQTAWAATYQVDESHSAVGFKIRHLFARVRGSCDQFSGTFEYEPGKPETWKAKGTVQAASINTRNVKRDEHLRSADFFDVEKYPTLEFTADKATDVQDSKAKLHGTLKMHGVEKPVVFDLEIHGAGPDPWGKNRFGGTAVTTINRKDFGIIWNKAGEAGEMLLGDEVEIILEVEGIEKT